MNLFDCCIWFTLTYFAPFLHHLKATSVYFSFKRRHCELLLDRYTVYLDTVSIAPFIMCRINHLLISRRIFSGNIRSINGLYTNNNKNGQMKQTATLLQHIVFWQRSWLLNWTAFDKVWEIERACLDVPVQSLIVALTDFLVRFFFALFLLGGVNFKILCNQRC